MSAPALTQAMLKGLVSYDPETGQFIWLARDNVRACWNTQFAGRPAGFPWRCGRQTYLSIRIFDWPFLGHRLAWLYMTGSWPDDLVDHRDLDGMNNRWSNLRAADKSQNGANTKAPRTNTTGFKGVCRNRSGTYRATIRISGKQKWLGDFQTAEAAHAAYCVALAQRSGEFARTS